tara:strand:+ start:386 stop:898 length:513 start_codon:yes stop_codon:yes gene_type:complete
MIKLKDLLTENRIRNIERSEVAHVNKEFERLVKGINKSWDIGADPSFFNFKDGTRNFQLIASIGQDSIQLNFNLSSLPSHIRATQINFQAHEYETNIRGKQIMDTTWKIKVDDDTDLVKLFKKESKIKSNVKKAIKKIEGIREKAAKAQSDFYSKNTGYYKQDGRIGVGL